MCLGPVSPAEPQRTYAATAGACVPRCVSVWCLRLEALNILMLSHPHVTGACESRQAAGYHVHLQLVLMWQSVCLCVARIHSGEQGVWHWHWGRALCFLCCCVALPSCFLWPAEWHRCVEDSGGLDLEWRFDLDCVAKIASTAAVTWHSARALLHAVEA